MLFYIIFQRKNISSNNKNFISNKNQREKENNNFVRKFLPRPDLGDGFVRVLALENAGDACAARRLAVHQVATILIHLQLRDRDLQFFSLLIISQFIYFKSSSIFHEIK